MFTLRHSYFERIVSGDMLCCSVINVRLSWEGGMFNQVKLRNYNSTDAMYDFFLLLLYVKGFYIVTPEHCQYFLAIILQHINLKYKNFPRFIC